MRPAFLIFAQALYAIVLAAGWDHATAAEAGVIPACRLEDSTKAAFLTTLTAAAAAFMDIGKPLPFDDIKVNEPATQGKKTLVAYIVEDANLNNVSSQGCSKGAVNNHEPLDSISVRGGCVLMAVESMEMRCSASAVRIFGDVGQKIDRSNPALLYVLSHELGHLYQKRLGEYAGRVERLDLSWDRASKLKALQNACDPMSTRKEEEADAIAVEVLIHLLPQAPYREPLFSDRGALYWNVDQLSIASDAWQQASLEREFISRSTVHEAFVPTELPTPAEMIELNAHHFVCDVLIKTSGSIYYPSRSLTHPPVEQRLRRIAEALQPIANSLPDNSSQRQFASVARLQTDLSSIFTYMYRETGVYMEAVQASICTQVNAPTPPRCQQ